MKTVAVSQQVDAYPDRNERRDALDQRVIQFLLVAGYIPVPVPNGLCLNTSEGVLKRDAFDTWADRIQPQTVLLSGGNDIGICHERDIIEDWLLDYAEQHHCPVLGICRGMQMIGRWAGTELKPVAGHVRTRHVLTGEISGEVNSYHNYALCDCPDDYVVSAYSEDGIIEAISHSYLSWEGWMWHPEREHSFRKKDIQRLQSLFS